MNDIFQYCRLETAQCAVENMAYLHVPVPIDLYDQIIQWRLLHVKSEPFNLLKEVLGNGAWVILLLRRHLNLEQILTCAYGSLPQERKAFLEKESIILFFYRSSINPP